MKRWSLAILGSAGVFEVDTMREADRDRLTFVPDQEKAAIDLLADQEDAGKAFVAASTAGPVADRSYFSNGSGIAWSVPTDLSVNFSDTQSKGGNRRD